MRTTQCVRAGWLMGALGACMLVAGAARADVTTQRPGSILIFPKVVNDGLRKTVIQITNTSNTLDFARCFYLAGQRGANGKPLCSEIDFELALTRQQPTSWSVDLGRRPGGPVQMGAGGLSPGAVPAVPLGFTGALICAEVDASDAPVAVNALKGEATLFGPGSDASTYNGLAVQGGSVNNKDNVLDLNGSEYNACPAGSRVDFVASDAPDPVINSLGNAGQCSDTAAGCNSDADCTITAFCATGVCSVGGAPCNAANPCAPGSTCDAVTGVVTEVTVLPCNLDLNALVPTNLSLVLTGTDTEETPLSGSKTMSCWESFTIDTSSSCAPGYGRVCLTKPNTTFATVDITSGSGGPILAIAQAFHVDALQNISAAAVNVQTEGQCIGQCRTAGGGPTGVPCLATADCAPTQTCSTVTNAGASCSSSADCGSGVCSGPRFCSGGTSPGRACTVDANCAGGGTCPLPSATIRLPGA